MKTSLLLLTFVSALAFADETPTQPVPVPEDPKVSPVAEIAYVCTASSGKEQHALTVTAFQELSHREPPLRMKIGGTWMSFTAFEMNGKVPNLKMLNLAIQASDKKGRPITAQRAEYYGQTPIKDFYVRLAFGKASISCEMK